MNTSAAEVAASHATGSTLGQRSLLFGGIAIFGLVADLCSKSYMFSQLGLPHEARHEAGVDWWIVEDFFGFQTAVNQGALFGWGEGAVILFRLFSLVALVAIGYWFTKARGWESLWLTICLAAVFSGILGNLYDRCGLWHTTAFAEEFPDYACGVRDYILFTYRGHRWPNFNIADCLLVCGAVMLVIFSFRNNPPRNTSNTEPAAENES